MRVVRIGLALLLLSSGPTLSLSAQPDFLKSTPAFEAWRQRYYRWQHPQSALDIVLDYPDSLLYRHVLDRARVARFLSGVFMAHPPVMQAAFWAAHQLRKEEQRLFLLNVLWLVNNEPSIHLLVEASRRWQTPAIHRRLNELALYPPKDLYSEPLDHPNQVRELWELFFATGDNRAVERVARQMVLLGSEREADWRIGAEAKVSLKEYIQRHALVYEACSRVLVGAEEDLAQHVEEVLRSVEDRYFVGWTAEDEDE
jgi:hypothetical protein